MKKILLMTALFASAFLTESCSEGTPAVDSHDAHAHGANDAHDHSGEAAELPEFKYFKLVDNYEVYLGITSLVVDQSVHFHVNVTNLDTYKAVIGAKAIVNIGELSTPEKTTANGILHFGLKPTKAGLQTISIDLVADGKPLKIVLGEIMVFGTTEEALHGPKPSDDNKINLAKVWMWSNLFGVEVVKEAPFNEVIRTRGEIIPSTIANSYVVAPTDGKVSFSKNIIPGKKVSSNESIANITSKGLENNIDARYAKLEAEYETAESNYNRNVILAKDLIVSQEVLRDSYTTYITTKENFMSLKKIHSKSGIKVIVHNSSTITEVLVAENQFVSAGDPIARIQLNKPNLLKVEISKQNLNLISKITDANFIPEYTNDVLNVKTLKGSLIPSNIATLQNSAYIPVYFTLPLHKDVVANSYAEVFAIVGSKMDVISVPNESISENEGLYWIYVQTNGEQFEKRDVILGGGDGNRRIVLSGLVPGEVVVTFGSAKVRQSETSGVEIPHGHTH